MSLIQRRLFFLCIVFHLLGSAVEPVVAAGGGWPQWRGPNGQGHADAAGLPLPWSEKQNIRWKTSIPGRGHSSPVMDDGLIWMTTAYETPTTEKDLEDRLKANTGGQPLTLLSELRLHAIGVDPETGRLEKNIPLLTLQNPQWVHKQNSYASPTPVIEKGRLYCHFGTYGTVCLDTSTGRVVWENHDLEIMHENGPGSTPVLWDDHLIVHCDGSDSQYIAALDKRTGKLAWKTPRSGEMNSNPQLKKSYGTPLIVEFGAKPQVISPGSDWLYSYEPSTGKELWKVNYGTLGFSIVPRPVIGHGHIYFSTSFMRPQLLAVQYDGTRKPEISWRYKRGVPTIPSPLLVESELYFVNDSGGIVTCLDAETGKEYYRERLGGNHNASPIFADGRIYLFSREGETVVLAPGKEFKVLERNTLEGQLMASVAVIGKAIIYRSDTSLYRIETSQ